MNRIPLRPESWKGESSNPKTSWIVFVIKPLSPYNCTNENTIINPGKTIGIRSNLSIVFFNGRSRKWTKKANNVPIIPQTNTVNSPKIIEFLKAIL